MLQRPFASIVEEYGKHFCWTSIFLHVHIQSWEEHFLCPCENFKRKFIQSNNLKAYISEKQCDFFSLHASLKEQISTITHTLIYTQFYFGESIQNTSYSNLANMLELQASSSCFTSWNLWSCLAKRVYIFLTSSNMTVNLFGFSFTTCSSSQACEFAWRSKEISASKITDYIRDRLNRNANKASFMSKWYNSE
jgi:hypothetical protein